MTLQRTIASLLAAKAAAMPAKSALRRTNRRRPVSQVLMQFQLPFSGKTAAQWQTNQRRLVLKLLVQYQLLFSTQCKGIALEIVGGNHDIT